MNLIFAGLARNCQDQIEDNIKAILRLCASIPNHCWSFWILENDSDDQTRYIIQHYQEQHDRIKTIFLDHLDSQFPNRLQRLAFCRQHLLDAIRQQTIYPIDSTYIPLDLDSHIAQSIDHEQFFYECRAIQANRYIGIFPISQPYYYDILALRCHGWCNNDYMSDIRSFWIRGGFGRYISLLFYMSRRQRSITSFKPAMYIDVVSAFGGVGIYHFDSTSSASYLDRTGSHLPATCEHVYFNSSLNGLAISTNFIVDAPFEHIELRSKSIFRSILELFFFLYRDLKLLLSKWSFFRETL